MCDIMLELSFDKVINILTFELTFSYKTCLQNRVNLIVTFVWVH